MGRTAPPLDRTRIGEGPSPPHQSGDGTLEQQLRRREGWSESHSAAPLLGLLNCREKNGTTRRTLPPNEQPRRGFQ